MTESLSRKYVLWLTAVAVAILGIGAWLRPKKTQAKAPSPSETASLQRIVRREELRNMGSYFAERASGLGDHLVYLKDQKSSGVYWGRLGQVLTAGEELPLETAQTEGTATPPPEALVESNGGRWVLIVWIEGDQKQLEWTAALDGGRRVSSCAGESYRELIVSAALTETMRGAAVFDLDGVLVGMVATCDGALHVVSAPTFKNLIRTFETPEKKLPAKYGIAVSPGKDGKGLFVDEVVPSGAAYAAGIRAGQTLSSANTPAELFDQLEKKELPSKAVPDFGLEVQTQPAVTVTLDSEAYKLGLRTGDHLIQPPLSQLRTLLNRKNSSTVIVFERGGRHYARTVTR